VPRGTVTIRLERCKQCGICVALCPVENLCFEEALLKAADKCTGCMLCEMHCPHFAITAKRLKETEVGAAEAPGGEGRD